MHTNPAWTATRMLTLRASSRWTLNRLGRRDRRIVAFQWAATPKSCRAARSQAGSNPSTLMLMLGHSLAPSPDGRLSRLPHDDGAENLRHPARSLPGKTSGGARSVTLAQARRELHRLRHGTAEEPGGPRPCVTGRGSKLRHPPPRRGFLWCATCCFAGGLGEGELHGEGGGALPLCSRDAAPAALATHAALTATSDPV
eukprot:scaffold104905_cov66-Phaeocystis_antarctica.AAC.2